MGVSVAAKSARGGLLEGLGLAARSTRSGEKSGGFGFQTIVLIFEDGALEEFVDALTCGVIALGGVDVVVDFGIDHKALRKSR
jgi:hypothetical protein